MTNLIEKPKWASGSCAIDPMSLEWIQHRMLTQDNRATAYPIFEVRDDEHIYGIDPKFDGRYRTTRVLLIYHNDSQPIEIEVDADDAGAKLLEFIHNMTEWRGITPESIIAENRNGDRLDIINGQLDPDDIFSITTFMDEDGNQLNPAAGTGRLAITKTVAIFFTKESADGFIKNNRHHLDNPHVYVSSAWNNHEMRVVMNMLAMSDMEQIKPRSRESDSQETKARHKP